LLFLKFFLEKFQPKLHITDGYPTRMPLPSPAAAGPPWMAAVTNSWSFAVNSVHDSKTPSPKTAGRRFWAAQGIEAEQKTFGF
jgi:hypothetical protein